MQTYSMDPHDLAAWVENRLLRLTEDGGSVHIVRGYADYAAGRWADHENVAGDAFAGKHYDEGYELAAYELGNITSIEGAAA
jgi:hypothetical protein